MASEHQDEPLVNGDSGSSPQTTQDEVYHPMALV
jgi:hypothetical protein